MKQGMISKKDHGSRISAILERQLGFHPSFYSFAVISVFVKKLKLIRFARSASLETI